MDSDLAIQMQFFNWVGNHVCERVALFWGVGQEIDTQPLVESLLQWGMQVLLPVPQGDGEMLMAEIQDIGDLEIGPYGIPMPSSHCPVHEKVKIDLLVVPALCYDRNGYRLGQGGGYYDRYLADYGGITVGLCPECMLQEVVPTEEFDCKVDWILTENQSLSTKG